MTAPRDAAMGADSAGSPPRVESASIGVACSSHGPLTAGDPHI